MSIDANPVGGDLPTVPDRTAFLESYARGEAQIVSTRLVADLETPVSAYLKLSGDGAMSFLLESVEGGAQRGRYSIIGARPDVIWRAHGNTAEINRAPDTGPDQFETLDAPTLDALRSLLAESAIPHREDLPPMAAGVFGYMGYDTVRLIERLPDVPSDELGVPDAIMMRPTLMVIFDAVRDEMTLATPVRPSEGVSGEAAFALAHSRLADAVGSLQKPLPQGAIPTTDDIAAPEAVSNTSEARYLEMVAKAKDYIAAGDIFQVVLAQRFTSDFALPPFALYRSLRRLNPSPFLFHLDFGDFALVGSSPEILVRAVDGEVTIRPIAGTRKRGADASEDAELQADLLADPKERAEHLMLLDLGRNDVGRVSIPDTVRVTEGFTVERYSHVMHIVSNVIGQLDTANHDEVDALMAGFPAGTVSGAPKVRAMEVIDELEATKRGPYAGCVGYFSADGNMDTCIVLRTALVKDGKLHVQAGAGIVHDSIPASEQQECINKAMALVRAAEEAVAFAGGPVSGGRTPKGNRGIFG
ncbi:MAG: anthranilate synthase component I [Pseudomonadota bacterium]